MTEAKKYQHKKFDLKENSKPFIFIVCLFIASALWFINAMEKQYENTVMIPIEFTNLPKNKTLVNPPPKKLKARIKAKGFTLVRYKLSASIYPINFNIRSFTNNRMEKDNSQEFIILTDNYIPQITDQLNSDISILDLSPDTLLFLFDRIIESKKKVISNLDLSFENQHFQSDSIHFRPKYVTVKGPSSLVDSIEGIHTKPEKFENLNSTIQENVALEEIDQLEISPEKVIAEIPVSQYTEYIEKVVLTKKNIPDSLNVITFPGRVELNCIVSLDQFKKIKPTDFVVGIDYKDIKPGSKSISLKVFSTPTNTKIINIQPSTVEYIIEKK